MFVIGAVGIGLFNSANLGYYLLIIQYTSAILAGLLFRFICYKNEDNENSSNQTYHLHKRAFRIMLQYRRKNYQNFGSTLRQAVVGAVETMLMIGGFIVLFVVVAAIMQASGVISFISDILSPVLNIFISDSSLHEFFFTSIIEMSSGISNISLTGINRTSITLISSIIAFGGLSIIFQSISFISKTDINSKLFILSKIIQAIFAAILTIITFPLAQGFFTKAGEQTPMPVYNNTISNFTNSSIIFTLLLAILAITAATAIIFHKKLRLTKGQKDAKIAKKLFKER